MKKNILQRAEAALEYWGEEHMWGRLIVRDIDANDLEALEFHLKEACAEQEMIDSADLFAKGIENWLITGNKDGLNDRPV